MPRVVWAEESKNGLRFGIGPSYDVVPTTPQCLYDGQSSCRRPLFCNLGHSDGCLPSSAAFVLSIPRLIDLLQKQFPFLNCLICDRNQFTSYKTNVQKVNNGTIRRKMRNKIFWWAVSFKTCLADELQPALHIKFIC